MESNALEKLTNNIVASRFFARTSRIQRIVKICDVVDLFFQKPFWFFLSIFSTLGSMCLHIHMSVYIYIYIYIYIYYICVYVYIHIYIYVYVYRHIWIYIYICVYIYIYIHAYIGIIQWSLYSSIASNKAFIRWWLRHGFGAKASWPLTQSAPAVTHNTTRLCWIDVTLWECHIHADAVRALSLIFVIYFLLSDGEVQD